MALENGRVPTSGSDAARTLQSTLALGAALGLDLERLRQVFPRRARPPAFSADEIAGGLDVRDSR